MIKKLEIVSFGKLKDETIEFNQGFNYFFGPNETGKTTIRMFMTYLLFGLTKDERDRYISIYDNQLGGRLYINLNGIEFVVERFLHRHQGKRLVYVQGEQVSDEYFEAALKGMNRFLYESVFSFQDRDLNMIRTKTPDDIGKVLFNLGMTGSDDILRIEKDFEKQADELFKPKGRNQPIYKKLKHLEQINKQIKELSEKESQHQALYRDLEAFKEDLNQQIEEEQKLNLAIHRNQLLFQSKKQITNIQRLDQELKQFDDYSNMNHEIIDRYNILKDQQLNIKKDIQVLETRIYELKKSENEMIVKSDYTVNQLNELEQMALKAEQLVEQLKDVEKKITDNTLFMNQIINETGLNLNELNFDQLKVNQYTEEHWKRLEDSFYKYQDELEHIDAKLRVKEKEQLQLQEKIEQLKLQLPDEEEYRRLKEEEEQIHYERLLQSKFSSQWQNRKGELKKQKKHHRLIKFSLPIFYIVLTLFYVFGLFSNTLTDYVFMGSLTLIVLLFFVFTVQAEQKVKRELDEISENISNKISLNQNVIEKLSHIKTIEEDIKHTQLKLDHINSLLQDHLAEKERLEQLIKQNEIDIESTINEYPFLRQFEIYQWKNVHQSLLKVKQYKQAIEELNKRKNDLQIQLKEKEQIAESFVLLFYERVEEDSIWRQFTDCITFEKDSKQKYESYQKLISDLDKDKDELIATLQPIEQELMKLYQSTKVHDEEQFLIKIEQFKQYEQLMNERRENYEFIYEIFGEETERMIHSTYNWPQLEIDNEQLKNRLEACQNAINEIRKSISNKEAEIGRLEADGTLSDLIHQRADLVEQIKQLAKQYAIYKTAKGFLEDTKSRYQNVYLPKIIEYTTNFFNQITDGEYVKVRFSYEEETIDVRNKYGDWFSVKQLSEGTSDQLYVSLRLAINKVLNQQHLIPFILDDAFVHFDDDRKRRMFNILKELSNEQQIIYFSCQNEHDIDNYIKVKQLSKFVN